LGVPSAAVSNGRSVVSEPSKAPTAAVTSGRFAKKHSS